MSKLTRREVRELRNLQRFYSLSPLEQELELAMARLRNQLAFQMYGNGEFNY
jgi:hypothetical protein